MRVHSLFVVIMTFFSLSAAAQPRPFNDQHDALSQQQALGILDQLLADDEPLCLSYAQYAAVAYSCARTHENNSPALYTGCVEKFYNNLSLLPEHDSKRVLLLVESHGHGQDGALLLGVSPARLVSCAVACEGAINSETHHLFYRGQDYRKDVEHDCSLEVLAPGLAELLAADHPDF